MTNEPTARSDGDEVGYYKYLAEIMQKTRGSRFAASNLLVVKERASLIILSILTIFLIALSVLTITGSDSINPSKAQTIGILSVVASIAVLTITIFDYAMGRGLLAAKLHENALLVTSIMREMERELVSPSPSIETLRKCAARYEEINISTNVNHSSTDFLVHTLSRKSSKYILMNAAHKTWSAAVTSFIVLASVWPGLMVLFGVAAYSTWLIFCAK
ncbi:SLATT domain-containing protein [Aminobacter anthyllidis]|uniref:SLATT domain-containing protein n=1 Tax=Aminobacter anthyllidis TaxID=1035067 RepID=UPI002456A25C|nr:SLATT domain-containing protein [Aminobacter anthyllidis]MDH4986814.1 SLATT domain-containing protein [Aminobacter anthyllidis]